MSKYISRPHLINGYKYDLRCYALVSSFDPLRIYLYNEGLVRFATEKYSLDNLSQRFGHLTNFSVNKKSKKFVSNDNSAGVEQASKWSFKQLKKRYEEEGINYEFIMS